jgi:hypothetical protein
VKSKYTLNENTFNFYFKTVRCLNLTLLSVIQLKALHELPVPQRIAHLNSTVSLVNLSKTMREYARIINNAIITKHSLKLNETDDRGLLINEAITARQDSYSI